MEGGRCTMDKQGYGVVVLDYIRHSMAGRDTGAHRGNQRTVSMRLRGAYDTTIRIVHQQHCGGVYWMYTKRGVLEARYIVHYRS